MRRFRLVLVCAVLLSIASFASGEEAAGIPLSELFPWAELAPGIPSQAGTVGVEPAERPLRHGELIRYLEALAASSPRAVLRKYSETHEGRPLVYLAIGDEATIARLDEFRAEHAHRVDPRGRNTEQDAAALDSAKAVAWIAYGIHGDELSSTDASATVAHWLVAGEDDLARRMRDGLVVLIDPCENPDGRDRFLAQTASFAHAQPNPDIEDLSHTTVWPWGRGNHYLFDLNRDWFSMVQPESRRSAEIARWNPQLMVDSHEMGASDTYLFSPPRHPFNPHIPSFQWDWADRFAADQARALDGRGYSYYTREWNEEFFPGYGSSWASYLGAVGILYEMSSTEGTLVRQRPGTLRTFAQAVEHQATSTVANLTTLLDNRAGLLADYVAGRREVMEKAKERAVAAWILPEGRHPDRTAALVRLLGEQGIEVLRAAASPPRVAGLRDARTGEEIDASSLPAATWMVPADQPAGALVRVLLDPHIPMDAKFFQEEREYIERGKGSRLYEITAWSLPLSYGVEAYWTSRRPTEGWELAELEDPRGGLDAANDPIGYAIDGRPDASAAALADLLQRGLSARVAGKPFSVAGRDLDRGTIVIKREGNPDDVEAQLRELAVQYGIRIASLPTAKAESGPDLGGRHFRPLVAPRVGIWTGAGVSSSHYGHLWHLLDLEVGLRFSGLDLSGFGRTDLSRYNVLIFPPSRRGPGAYREMLGVKGVERLKLWIEAGGTAIGIGGGGTEFLADKQLELTKTRLRSQALDRYPPVVLGPGATEAERGGAFHAIGLRAEADDDEDSDSGDDGRSADRSGPYDVAPIVGAGARPFTAGVDLGTPVEMRPLELASWLKPILPPGKAKPDEKDLERADARLRRYGPQGTFLRVDLDSDRWLTWGLPGELPALVRTQDGLVAEPPVQVPARFADLERLHLGGLLWPEAAARLANTAYATREGVGRGQVILFVSPPEFRGWTLATRRLLLNAILYGPGLGTRWSTPW